jgi:hypothetical protein
MSRGINLLFLSISSNPDLIFVCFVVIVIPAQEAVRKRAMGFGVHASEAHFSLRY